MKVLCKPLLIITLLILSNPAYSEYRVYQYVVKSRLKAPHADKGYVVTSTLDPTTYIAYHGGDSSIKVDLVRTWMCKGYTGAGAELCTPPQEQQSESEN